MTAPVTVSLSGMPPLSPLDRPPQPPNTHTHGGAPTVCWVQCAISSVQCAACTEPYRHPLTDLPPEGGVGGVLPHQLPLSQDQLGCQVIISDGGRKISHKYHQSYGEFFGGKLFSFNITATYKLPRDVVHICVYSDFRFQKPKSGL